MNYELAYRVGFHPWEDAEAHSPFTKKISELFGQEESGREPPYGPALDLGTGSGIWAVQLAKRGWQVTGVELVEKALRRAHDRVKNDGVALQLVQGDVTALRAAGVGSGPLIRGVSRNEIEGAFPGWTVNRRRSIALPGAEANRGAAETRRALVSAPPRVSSGLGLSCPSGDSGDRIAPCASVRERPPNGRLGSDDDAHRQRVAAAAVPDVEETQHGPLHRRLPVRQRPNCGVGTPIPGRPLSLSRLPQASWRPFSRFRGVPSGCGEDQWRNTRLRRAVFLSALRLIHFLTQRRRNRSERRISGCP